MSKCISNWKELLTKAFESNKESWEDVEYNSLTKTELEIPFCTNFRALEELVVNTKDITNREIMSELLKWHSIESIPFTLWTKNRVYFPTSYDGTEQVASVPRNPCKEKTKHVGGG